MATILSTPTPLIVSSAGNPALRVLAASMAPGTWAQVTPANDQNSFLGVGPISGSMIHYCNSMPWNPRRQAIEIVAMDHGPGTQRYVRYDAMTNAFVLVLADVGDGPLGTPRHGYDHSAVNPFTGDLFHRVPTGASAPQRVIKYPLAGSAFADVASTSTLFYSQIGIGACWWSGSFTGAGAQGCLLLYNSGDSAIGGSAIDGGMYAFNPLTDTWFWKSQSMSPYYGTAGYSYHSVMEYSAVHNVAVYGGGGDNPRKLWRLNADRSSTAMPDVPSGKAVGCQLGNLAVDPVTGNFLLLSADELWELNPLGAGAWTRQTGPRAPPTGVGRPGPSTSPDGVVSCDIPDYGVVAYLKQTSSTGGTFFVYKHA